MKTYKLKGPHQTTLEKSFCKLIHWTDRTKLHLIGAVFELHVKVVTPNYTGKELLRSDALK